MWRIVTERVDRGVIGGWKVDDGDLGGGGGKSNPFILTDEELV